MKKNIRIVLLGELILFAVIFLFIILTEGQGLSLILCFIDPTSLILIMMFLIPGLIIMGEWKDFVRSFSVGISKYSLLELKNILGAVQAAQRLTVYGALFAIIVSGVIIMSRLDDISTIGPNLAVCFLAGFYAVITEFFLLPLRLNAERKMNEEMDFSDD
jgi:flagellar motor component MotA